MTYEKCKLDLGPYQEGNLASIDLEMDETFPMEGVGVTLQVKDSEGTVIIEKSSYEDDITIAGQDITIPLLPGDTETLAGRHKYEIDFINASNQPFATIGGIFIVEPEINTLKDDED